MVAIVQTGIGGVQVGLATAAVVLLLLTWQLWATSVRTRRVARAAGEELAAVRARYGELDEKIAELEERMQDQAETIEYLKGDRARYEDALLDLVVRSRRQVIYKRMQIVYEIGESPQFDKVVESYVTTAASDTDPLLWLHIDIAPSSADVEAKSSFRDLEGVRAFEVREARPPIPLTLLPASSRNGRMWAIVFFNTEIGTVPREWRLVYQWNGAWNPLRQTLRDKAILSNLGRTRVVKREVVSVTFVFPATARNPQVQTSPRSPEVPSLFKTDLNGRSSFTFEMLDPGNDDYEWLLSVDGFSTQVRRP